MDIVMKITEQTEELSAVEQSRSWAKSLEEIATLIGGRFSRSESRGRALIYLRGLLSPVERKNGWQLAEEAGDETPYATQHLLGRAVWSADDVRDDLREYVVKHLGDEDGVLVVDETGVLKKGTRSAGGATPVFRNSRSGRELSDWSFPGLCDPSGENLTRPRTLSAALMDGGQRAVERGRSAGKCRVRDKIGNGSTHDRTREGSGCTVPLGGWGRGLR